MKKLLSPEDIQRFLAKRFTNQHRAWLGGDGSWPLPVSLGMPAEADVVRDAAGVRQWVDA
uniref:DUF3322 domain-containing protein n=1 Tax=Stenotrophomonas maltophilia TaxID=40324 RepID=UPI003CCFF409